MSLVKELIENRINKRLEKRLRLMSKVEDLEKEKKEIKASLNNSSVYIDFVDRYFNDKIERLDSKIKRIEKRVEKDAQKYKDIETDIDLTNK